MMFFRENLSLKIASLALAVGVWFYVRGEDKPVQILTVPLDLEGLPSDLAIASVVADTVNVRVQAPEVILRALGPEKLVARVDLSGAAAGDQTIRIRPDNIGVPPGVEVQRVSPEYLPLRVEKKIRRDLPVRARIAGEPASGHVLGQVGVSPSQVTVEGAESAVRRAREVDTDIVRIDGRSSPFDVIVSLFPDVPGVDVVNEEGAMLSIDLHERYVTRVLSAVRVVVEGAAGAVRLAPPTVEVTLEGPPGLLPDLAGEGVTARIDVSPLAPQEGDYRMKPRIELGAGVSDRITVRSVRPEEVAVRVARRRGR